MTVQLLTDSSKYGVFSRLGKILYAHERIRTAATNLATDLDNIYALYRVSASVSGSTDQDLEIIGNLVKKRDEILGFVASIQKELETAAKNTVVEMVNADVSLADKSIYPALEELSRQMVASSSTLEADAITTTGPLTPADNVGNSTMFVSTIPSQVGGATLSDDNPYIRTETLTARCVQDSAQGAQAGNEVWSIRGGNAVENDWYEWPAKSGLALNIVAGTATTDAGGSPGQNILTNSDMESFTSHVPDNWELKVGVAGTQTTQTTSAGTYYDGGSALKVTGNGSTLTNLAQKLNNSTSGTAGILRPDTTYLMVARVARGASQPTAGVLKFQIENETSGSVLATANSGTAAISVDCTSGSELTTSFATKSLVFRTSTNPTTSLRMSIEFTTALSNTHIVYIDGVCLIPLYQPYAGSAAFGILAGNTDSVIEDSHTAAFSNNYAGKWFRELDRFFDLYTQSIYFPGTTGTATVADSVIA
tara:strand:+ start:575 stop:2011 length:1437 start_codon:yes stop_codon:yes gene_type:complete